ncbi:MFS transporter [Desulfotomaculum copahuensis]|uniref:Major facilitator superfamily (MFS) profile domain-containing protein n=1 Tax=Desulfotomaculum copahuensis TaxID=1838280 RepID=A0A1B7LAH8_9FIRM|nr:MFS transporter [Desulfotomaculum copahuensis]OAT79338.1 hypothetical protein A6M21_15915 [Desulfotomaculum copahuensis]
MFNNKAFSINYIFLLINLAIYLDTLLYGIIVPVVPYYAGRLGASPGELGVIFAAYAAGLLLAGVPAGMACDRYGYKPVLLPGMIGLTLSTVLFAFSGGVFMLSVSRLLQGISSAATWSAGLALVASLYPAQMRGQKMGLVMTSTGLGTISGPVLGGMLYQYAGYLFPFLLTAVAGAVLSVLLWRCPLPENNTATGKGQQTELKMLRNRNIFWSVAVTVAGSFGFGMLEPLLPLDLNHRFGLTSAGTGLLFGALSMAFTLCQPVFGYLSDRLGRKPLVTGGLLATALTAPWLGRAPTLEAEALLLALYGTVSGASSATALPLLADSTEAVCLAGANTGSLKMKAAHPNSGMYGTAYGIFNTAYSLGLVAGPLIGALIAGRWNLTTALTFYSLLLGITALGVILQLKEKRQKKAAVSRPATRPGRK